MATLPATPAAVARASPRTAAARRELGIGLACAALTVAVWTAFLLISRAGARGTLTPYDLVALRFGIAGLIMLPVLARLGGWRGLGPARAAALVLLAGPLFALLAFTGFAYAPASHAAVLMPGLLPFWAALLAWLALGQRPGRARLAGLALTLAGVALLAMAALREAPPGAWVGDLIFPLAPLAWAGFTTLARRWEVPALRATSIVAVGSMLLYLPVYALLLPKGLAATPAAELIGQGLFQGVLAVIVSLWAYTRAVEALGVGITATLTAAVPVLAALLAVPLLGEPLTPLAGAGLAFVTLGMLGAVLELRRR